MRRQQSQVIMCNECRIPMWRRKVLGKVGYTCTRCGQGFTLEELARKPLDVRAAYIQPSLLPDASDISFDVSG